MNKKANDILFVICMVFFVLVCIGLVVMAIVHGQDEADDVCKKICDRKGCDFINVAWDSCKCLTEGGDIVYHSKS